MFGLIVRFRVYKNEFWRGETFNGNGGDSGVTGIYEPLDQPEPSPPTGPVPRPPQDTGKPGGQLPQTNFIQRLDWVILGSLLLITALNIYVVKQLIKKGKSTFPKWG